MATCPDCERDMVTAEGCTLATVEIDGEAVPRMRHRKARGHPAMRCGDCGAEIGQLHHLGCDMERCPRCRGQFFTCGCPDAARDDDEGDDIDDDWIPPPRPGHLRLV